MDKDTVDARWNVVANGLLWGIAVWTAYGLLEFTFFYSSQLFESWRQAVFTSLIWRLNTVCLLSYIVGGAAIGGISSAVALWMAPGAIRKFGSCAVPASLSAIIVVGTALTRGVRFGGFAICTLLVMVVLAAAMFWAMRKPHSSAAGWSQFSPLVLWLLILGPYWLCSEVIPDANLGWKALASTALLILAAIAHDTARRGARCRRFTIARRTRS